MALTKSLDVSVVEGYFCLHEVLFICTKCYLGCLVVRHLSIGVNPVNP